MRKIKSSLKEASLFSRDDIFLGKLFWYQVHFDMHVRTHTREHLYHCSQCHYSSITKNCLKRHVIQKHSNVLLKCPTDGCNYSTPDKYKLQAHLKVHTELVSSKPGQQLVCPRCPLLSNLCAHGKVPRFPVSPARERPSQEASPRDPLHRQSLRYVAK